MPLSSLPTHRLASPERRIAVQGRVSLGKELKLKQSPAAVETTPEGHVIRSWMGQRIDYRLAPSPGLGPVEIVNDGLVTGFGIFGAPGTGKTRLLLHLLKQVLEVQPHQDTKFGGLILDPKAALLADVTEMWTELKGRPEDLIVIKPDFLNWLRDTRAVTPLDGGFHPDQFSSIRIDRAHHPTR